MTLSPPHESQSHVPSPRFGPPTTANPLWRVVVVSGAAFCVCCLLWITAGYADPQAPGNQWLNRHGLKLVAITGAMTVGSAICAMLIDARQTRGMADRSSLLPAPDTAETGGVNDCRPISSPEGGEFQEPQA